MRGYRALATVAIALSASGAAAQGVTLDQLKERSIVVAYTETVNTPQGSYSQTWRESVYVSSLGRVFHRSNLASTRAGSSRSFDAVGDQGGAGEGSIRKFAWTGNGFSRQWTNPRNGTMLRQTIVVAGSGGRFSCHMTVERLNRPAVSAAHGQSCRVTTGNVFAGR
jgi:hypothetical protein